MADSPKAGPSKDAEAKEEQRLEKQAKADAKEHEGYNLPEQKSDEDKKEQKEKFVEASKVDPDAPTPAEANPIKGAHLGSLEGAVDLTNFPGEAESVQEKNQERFDRGEDVKQ